MNSSPVTRNAIYLVLMHVVRFAESAGDVQAAAVLLSTAVTAAVVAAVAVSNAAEAADPMDTAATAIRRVLLQLTERVGTAVQRTDGRFGQVTICTRCK